MRTKTILLSAAIGALSSAALMAQVYSVNTVGYINVTCNTGFQIIADQLNSGNNVITNLITVDPAGSMDGDTIYKYNNATTNYEILTADSLNYPGIPWDGGNAATTTLNPGEAAFYKRANAGSITFTFVGTVMQNPSGSTNAAPYLTNSLAYGFNLVSSIVPQGGDITTNLGIVVDPAGSMDGDTIYTYNNATTNYGIYTADSLNYPSAAWDPSSPSISVGQGFFYKRANAGTFNWVRNFVVN
jgi:hypothetical protein